MYVHILNEFTTVFVVAIMSSTDGYIQRVSSNVMLHCVFVCMCLHAGLV